MDLKEIIDMAVDQKYDELIEELEKLPPRSFTAFYKAFSDTGKDLYYDLEEKLTEEQRKKFRWLGSSEREREYLLSIPEGEMTEQDWFDLKTTDF